MRSVLLRLSLAPLLLILCCSTSLTRDELLSRASAYTARMAFASENLSVFQFRGRASVIDGNLLANGPFVLWGSPGDGLLRGDFYGPDGKPVVSLRVDTAGALIYFPGDESAVYSHGGFPVGGGVLDAGDLIHLLRTGFPAAMEQWQVMEGAEDVNGSVHWLFTNASGGLMELILEPDDLFPCSLLWDDGHASITGSTWHDEFNAWPENWTVVNSEAGTEISITSLVHPAVPWESLWVLRVPFEPDTLEHLPRWLPAWGLPEH